MPFGTSSLFYFEDGEVDRAVGAVVYEAGKRAEIVGLVVFDDYKGTGFYGLACENFAGNFGKTVHVVWWVGKYDVERLGGCGQISQCVSFDEGDVVIAEQTYDFANKIILGRGFFDGSDMGTLAREKFDRYGACAGKQVERCKSFEVDEILNDVEDVLACEVGGWARGDVGWHVEASASVFTSDYSHNGSMINGNGALRACGSP